MVCAIVDGVAFHGIRGGASSRGRVQARRSLRPRLSSASGEVELAPKVLVYILLYYASRQGLSGGVHTHNYIGESLTGRWFC
jgi:hypothetical protein